MVAQGRIELDPEIREKLTCEMVERLKTNLKLLSFYSKNPTLVNYSNQSGVAISVDIQRINSSLDKITRAIYFDNYKSRWPMDFGFISLAIRKTSQDINSDILETKLFLYKSEKFSNEIFSGIFFGNHPEVLKYQIFRDLDHMKLIIKMIFFEGVFVLAISK